jgi:glycosyltransferase involved in cell wall biosynthesis
MREELESGRVTFHVITDLAGGGAERLLTNLVTRSPRSEPVLVISLQPEGVFRETLEAEGVSVVDLGMRRRRDALRGLWRLAALVRERRPDVIQGWMYHANILAFLALLLAGRGSTRMLWGIFCSDADHREYHWSFGVVRWLSRMASPFVDGIVYNAHEALAFHRAIGFREPRSVVISNGVDPAVFRHLARARGSIRDELGVAPDEVMLVIVARVDPMKDFRGLLAAVRDLPGIVTVAVGRDTDALPPQPGFIGLGWRDDIVRILSGADLFLLASAFGEGTSLALVEAMACGLACIVTNSGGNAAAVGEDGVVVAPGDPLALRDAVLQLARDPERRAMLGRAARARAAAADSADEILSTLRRFALSTEPPR